METQDIEETQLERQLFATMIALVVRTPDGLSTIRTALDIVEGLADEMGLTSRVVH